MFKKHLPYVKDSKQVICHLVKVYFHWYFQANGATFLANFSHMSDFFGLYDSQATKLDSQLQDLEEEIKKNDSEIQAIRKNLSACQAIPKKEAR